jgi:hypothetical protein
VPESEPDLNMNTPRFWRFRRGESVNLLSRFAPRTVTDPPRRITDYRPFTERL